MILTYVRLKSPSLCQRMLAWLGFIGFFNDGFALRLVPTACVCSPVSLFIIQWFPIRSDLVISGLNMFSTVASLRKIGSTFLRIHPLNTRTMRRLQWDSSSEVVLIMVVTLLSMLLFILMFRIGFFVIFFCFEKGTKSPLAGELPRWWRSSPRSFYLILTWSKHNFKLP